MDKSSTQNTNIQKQIYEFRQHLRIKSEQAIRERNPSATYQHDIRYIDKLISTALINCTTCTESIKIKTTVLQNIDYILYKALCKQILNIQECHQWRTKFNNAHKHYTQTI